MAAPDRRHARAANTTPPPPHHDILPMRRAGPTTTHACSAGRATRRAGQRGGPGYEGGQTTVTVTVEKPKNRVCSDIQQQLNRAHNTVRAIGRITAAVLVIPHIQHDRAA
ncbi:hypothetical protein Ahu01nite_072870 [Winogradskya humida]|uniref:Uncharacterized protein n=1 Tax=Winogradskya humida TaxID=113566 RepID=A0ABQ3ZZY9_9ACTN|nr:hypothetical protein Ahu01nite_072870 [Actinoplanes humidus]